MKEDYSITIKGRQDYGGDRPEEMCLSVAGSYREKDGVRFIVYKEYDDDDPTAYRTAMLKVEPDMVTMSRSGSATRLILERGRRHLCLYETEFGSLMLGIFTSQLDVDLDNKGGTLEIQYTLDVDSSLSSLNRLHIEVAPLPGPVEA